MNRFGCALVLILLTVPAWPAKMITVGELTDLLSQLQHDNKSDQEIATVLKQLQLSEELTRTTMNDLAGYAPGPLTTEQIYVLEAGSAVLAPPPSDIPTKPALDAAAQKALLDKANEYLAKTYAELPALTATQTTARFQDNVEAPSSTSGMVGGGREVTTGSAFANPSQYIRYIGSSEMKMESAGGVVRPQPKQKGARWGENGQIALLGPEPNPNTVFREAQDSSGLTFLRWEMINGRATAVFTFAVPKKKSHYAVDYCCFPDVSESGKGTFGSETMKQLSGAAAAGGNFQTATDWHDYKAGNVPYHGELFINPETGIVVRMITIAEFKNTDVVHRENQRIEYGPLRVGDKDLVLPVRKIIDTEVVPSGDSGSAGKYTTRRTMLTSEYKDFHVGQ